jgi:ferrochelatase
LSERVAILLMALGGPDSLESVGPYLNDLRGGRPTPPELVEEITQRYRLTGGRSPVLGITTELAKKLETRLQSTGLDAKVYVGLRHWHPSIAETYREIEKDGIRRVIGVCMAPQNSQMTVGAYIRKVEEARAQVVVPHFFSYVSSWSTHPVFIRAIAANIVESLKLFPLEVRQRVPILFTAHSLPERILQQNDPYPQEVRATVDAVVSQVRPEVWRFAYQSQGRSQERWLGPTVEETLAELEREGHRHVLVAPVGFVSDHVETLFDIDIELKKLGAQKGLRLERIPMLNATSPLVEILSDLITSHLRERVPHPSLSPTGRGLG